MKEQVVIEEIDDQEIDWGFFVHSLAISPAQSLKVWQLGTTSGRPLRKVVDQVGPDREKDQEEDEGSH